MTGAFSRLVPGIMGWLVVVITLALAPTIETYNGYVTANVAAATNASYMLGMTAIDDFGGFLIIFGLLMSGGFFAVTGMRNKNTSVGDMIGVIAAVILTIISMAMLSSSVIGYVDELITAGTGFAQTAYGILTIILYIGIISGATIYTGAKAYRKRSSRSNRSSGRRFA